MNAPAYRAPNRRTVEGIQKKITEKRERNPLSRFLNAKNDKETIVTWKSDLNTILHVFNVCSIIAAWISLTVHSQTELTITTHEIVSDVHHDVVDTRTMVTEIHRSVVKGQGGAENQHRSVSDVCISFRCRRNKQFRPPRHKSGQRSRLPMNPTSYICV